MKEQIKQVFTSIDIVSEGGFLLFGLMIYYRKYAVCDGMTTPYFGPASNFPFKTSNQILRDDCTAGSADMTLLVSKVPLFFLKVMAKWLAKKIIIRRHLSRTLGYTLLDQETTPSIVAYYPAALYQSILITVMTSFPLFLMLSWLPSFQKFKNVTRGCPNFWTTGTRVLTIENSVSADCDVDAYQWQRFSWAAQFLLMIVICFSQLQLGKVLYKAGTLLQRYYPNCFKGNRLTAIKACLNTIRGQLTPLAIAFFLTETPIITYILMSACTQFPNGFFELIKGIFTTGLVKSTTPEGAVTIDLYELDINLTQIDQKINYGIVMVQPFLLPFTLMLSTILHFKYAKKTQRLSYHIASFFRLLAWSGVVVPLTAFILFSISIGINSTHDRCYLTNFWNSIKNSFNSKSERIIPGDQQMCTLRSLAATQGTIVLETILLTELTLLPMATLLIIMTLLNQSRLQYCFPNVLKKINFLKPIPNQQAKRGQDEKKELEDRNSLSTLTN